MGRPSSYDPAFCEKVRSFAKEGATDLEIADYLEISAASLYRYKAEYPDFCEALKAAKSFADQRVEESLYHKALGYSFDSEEIRVLRDGQVVRVPTREHVPPDTTAAIFWLKNRQPERWRDKGPGESADNPLHIADVTDAKRLAAVALLAARGVKAESGNGN